MRSLSGSRPVLRWAWRMFRREWRQQALVLALLSVAVAAAIFSAAAAYNVAPAAGNADFGTVNHFLRFGVTDAESLESDIAYAESAFGAVDVIAHRQVPVPGAVEMVEYRAQDPNGPYGAPMLALRAGSYPQGASEIAVTAGLAKAFLLEQGSTFALDGVARTVVGVVENPSDLSADFALLDPATAILPESVTILVDGDDAQVFAFRAPSGVAVTLAQRPNNEDVNAALGVFGSATLAMLLVALIATASFAVLAQRRLRQLGMLAAVGATEQQLRLVMVANGVIVGAFAAAIGAALGVGAWVVSIPFIEPAVGHRLDWLNLPVWLVGTGMLLAVASATAAAWWPARSVARIPVVQALSDRPPLPGLARRSLALSAALVATGVICLALADRTSEVLIIAGITATVFGVLLVTPLLVRVVARPAARVPVAMRLALRDLARYQSRSGAALAAISLALGIAVATIVTASAAEYGAGEGNLAQHQVLIRIDNPSAPVFPPNFSPFIPEITQAELEAMQSRVDELADLLGEASVIALQVAMDPTLEPDPSFEGMPAVTLAEQRTMSVGGETRTGWGDVSLVFVASPEMLAYYGVDLTAIDPDTVIFTTESSELRITGVEIPAGTEPEVVTAVERLDASYTSLPGSFISLDQLQMRGWEAAPYGWLIEAGAPLTNAQLAEAREIAAGIGLTIEARHSQANLAVQRTGATAAGVLLALGILAMAVGLIRSEAASDLRTLTATGATSATRRMITAATAGSLGLLGALLGTAGAYLGLAAIYLDDIGHLTPVPALNLVFITIGMPLSAGVAGWLLSGRELSVVARRPID